MLSQLDTAQAGLAPRSARLVGVATLAPAPPSGPTPARRAPGRHATDSSVELAGVAFAYDGGPPCCTDVDLRIAPGERVALVGRVRAPARPRSPSWSPASTRPTAGAVRVGGVPVADAAGADALGRLVALVSQEVHVFAGPLADDLRLARPDATDDELRAALDRGRRHGVGRRRCPTGSTRSSATAGTAWRPPRPSSSPWPGWCWSTRPWRCSTRRPPRPAAPAPGGSRPSAAAAIEGRTALVVAHRLTQAVAADRVVVLDAGRVVEQGTHDELLDGRRPLRRPVGRLVRRPLSPNPPSRAGFGPADGDGQARQP